MNDLVERRKNRLTGYDYSSDGSYFLTICVKDMRCILSKIVGDVAPDVPTLNKYNPDVAPDVPTSEMNNARVNLTEYGETVKRVIDRAVDIYDNITIDKYVIMPNHVHILLSVYDDNGGTPGAASPTKSIIPVFISSFKRVTSKEIGLNIWQRSYHDHIIRDDDDFHSRWQYIDENPRKWLLGKDEYYS